jgi:hypothetical protein
MNTKQVRFLAVTVHLLCNKAVFRRGEKEVEGRGTEERERGREGGRERERETRPPR